MATIDRSTSEEKVEKDLNSFLGKIKYGAYPILIICGILLWLFLIALLINLLFLLSVWVGGVIVIGATITGVMYFIGHIRVSDAKKRKKEGHKVAWNKVNS